MIGHTENRIAALEDAIRKHVGPIASILDPSCHEGYVLDGLTRRFGLQTIAGLDVSEVALERARSRVPDVPSRTLARADLNDLYAGSVARLPVTGHYDVITLCETLYYVGPFAHLLWCVPRLQKQRKMRFLRALQAQATKALVLQHFGDRHRESIGAIARACGAVEVDKRWGIYVLGGTAARPGPASDPAA
jgi:trans-aconitate methyltransferase